MVFSINLYNKDIKYRYPEKSGEGNNDDSYRGYSLDTGHFDDDIFEGIINFCFFSTQQTDILIIFVFKDIVVSAPRGLNCKGNVEIFSSSFKLLYTFQGEQVIQRHIKIDMVNFF